MSKYLKITLGVVGIIILMIIIDLVCIFTINRPIFSQGEDYGTHAVYKGLFFNTYICPEFSTPQIKIKGAKYTCAVIEYDEIETKFEPTEIDGISMSIKEGTLTNKGATIIIKDTNGKGKYVYGTSFRVDKYVNGKWVEPQTTDNNCAFTSMAYYVDDNGYLEFNQNWNCMYSSLEKGTYRLVKYTFLESDTPITEEELKYFSIEFTIE